MKKFIQLSSAICILISMQGVLFAQTTGKKVKPSSSATIRIRDIEAKEKRNPKSLLKKKKIENENTREPRSFPVPRNAKGRTYRLTSPMYNNFKKNESLTEADFPAIGDNNTTIPPDLGGAVGPNHVMTALNSQVRIQDRSGTTISTVSLDGFFSPLVGSFNVFDPKVLYDPFAQRWILTAPANSRSATSSLLIAISSTSDPTASWTGYSFDVDAADANWFDYPSIGFNRNWIVVTGNLFQIASPFAFMNEQVYVFDKAAVYGGTATPTVFNQPTSEGFTICPAITLDNAQNTEYLVSNYNGNSGGNGYLRIYTITGTPSSPVYTATMLLPNVNQPWSTTPNGTGADFAPQNTVTQKFQNNDSRMQDVVFQNGSVWCAHTAFLPAASPTHSAAQWWQIDPTTANVQQFGRVEDAAAVNYYAFPSIAVNAYSDVLLGYSSFSANQFASSNYSFRLHTDPLNTMQPTVQFKAGLAKYYKIYSGTKNRWGDYTTTCIDPDNFSLWTLQEYAEMPGVNDEWGTEWTHVQLPVSNLYVQDVPVDNGAEPDPSSAPMWESQDIWLRKTQDAAHAFAHITEDAEYRTGTSNPNYVYVEVRNRGAAPSSGTEQLNLYWAKASSGLSWPDPWNGGIFFDPGPNTMLMGNPIATLAIPVVAAGSSVILEFPWNVPDPSVYTGGLAADQNHFCLLARVATSNAAPFGMTFPEQPGQLYANVQNNNKIAWKNIHIYDLLPGTQAPSYAVIGNLEREKMKVAVKFEMRDSKGKTGFLNTGSLKVTAEGRLASILERSKASGDGVKNTGKGSFLITRDGAMIRNINLNPRDFGTLKIEFVPKNKISEGYVLTVTQLKEVNGVLHRVGGQTLVFGRVKGIGTGK